ncbi:replication termination factor 2 [Impatiens glandulifera]|uniref:replication termination factor 2 n=1 Tax=Impatiens glandulifera TaxID=253017 RepID=UPI001FB1306C|nr:replication termination factor 2 [Impatiens glandulifera]
MISDQRLQQIFIEAPALGIPKRTLTLNRNSTIRDVKSYLFQHFKTLDSIFFTFNGRTLSDSSTIAGSSIPPLSTLVLQLRLLGGGGDGGATGAESRDCYLNMYAEKKPDKIDPNEQRLSKWTNCALTNEPLKHPVVVDLLGNIFKKEALVEALIHKKLPKAFAHIKGLKDMVPVQLSLIPGRESDNGDLVSETRFQCPITDLEFSGKYKFFALRSCGHVLSAKALKEIKSLSCHVCHKEYSESDKIPINGNEEEVAALREKMEEEKAKVREKRGKKVLKNGEVGVNGEAGVSLELDLVRLSGNKHGIEMEKASTKTKEVDGKIANGGGAAAAAVAVKSASSNGKRFKAGDKVPANATKEVYSSIFTSSKKKSSFKETYSCRSLPLGRN